MISFLFRHIVFQIFLMLFLFFSNAIAATETLIDSSSLLRLIWGLLVVLGLLLIIYAIAKKKMSFLQNPGKGIIKIIEVKHLLPKKSLYLIEVRGQEYLIASNQDSLSLISPIAGHSNNSFDEILENASIEE